MKQTNYSTAILGLMLFIVTSILTTSCNLFSSNQAFTTKEDSLIFARKVYAKYYNADQSVVVKFDSVPAQYAGQKTHPIDWDTVRHYRALYDQHPLLLMPDGTPYRGFKLDSSGFKMLKSSKYYELYIRLGRKDDQTYTFMILPIDKDGKLVQRSPRSVKTDPNDNYDHLDPCPENCPTDWDN